MTSAEREEIFNKECLTIADFQILFGVGYHDAARIIRNIRRRCDRLHIEGRIHTQDYFDYFELKTDRYIFNKKKPDEENLPDWSKNLKSPRERAEEELNGIQKV